MALPTSLKNILNNSIVEQARVEYKRDWNPKTILHTICAFANDIDNFSGGYIIIGIEEKNGVPIRPIKGLELDDIDIIQKEILEYCHKSIEPKYIPLIDVQTIDDKKCIVIWCYAGLDRPYKCLDDVYVKESKNKSYYIRKGSSSIKATVQAEKELFSLSDIIPFDDRINYSSSLNDININLIRKYLFDINSSLLDLSDNMSLEELCDNIQIISGPKEAIHPRNVGLLFFSYNPEKHIPYSYIDLTVIYDPTGEGMIEKQFKGPLNIQYFDVMQFIKNNIIEEKIFKVPGQIEAKRYFNYPYESIEELIGNALLHKNYQYHEPISIRITRETFEITSIPGFDSSINENDIINFSPKTRKYRNRRIAEFMKELHIAEAKNTGYPTIIKHLKLNESPMPIIEMDDERSYVTIILPINKFFIDSSSVETKQLSLEERIIVVLKDKPMRISEISKNLGYKQVSGTLKRIIKKMLEENKIKVVDKIYFLI